MMRIAALNDSSCESSNDEDVGPTQEILEAHATRFYRKAISHLAKEELSEAKEAIFEILKNPYIEKVSQVHLKVLNAFHYFIKIV